VNELNKATVLFGVWTSIDLVLEKDFTHKKNYIPYKQQPEAGAD
jgi:hypothetical protein